MATVGVQFRQILKALRDELRAQVTAGAIFPTSDTGVVYVTSRMNPPALAGKKSLVIVPLYSTHLQETTEGHGRCATYKKGRIDIYYRHEMNLDPSHDDDSWLLDDGGYYQTLEKVEDLFDLRQLDTKGIWAVANAEEFLLRHPMRAVLVNEPRKNYDDHSKGDGMVEIEVEFKAYRTIP